MLEMDGAFHKIDNNMNEQSAEQSQYIDNEKDRLAQEHGIEVIRIDCTISDFNYIKQNILDNASLNKLFDLNSVIWDDVLQHTLTNRMKEACDLHNEGMCVREIAKVLKITNCTIVRYLNNGRILNLCGYDGKIDKVRNLEKKVKCVEYNLIFKSVSKCALELSELLDVQLNVSGIALVCRGKRKSYHKMHFEYV
jgi:predicted transcriptional regulator